MGNNALYEIPEDLFSNLPELETIGIAYSGIRHFGVQRNLPKLKTLDLKFNKLSQLEFVEGGSPSTNLPLSNNRLSCGCGLFTELKKAQKAVKESSCNNPPHMRDVKLSWAENKSPRYFTKISVEEYVCEPVSVQVSRISDTEFQITWATPQAIRNDGKQTDDYCYTAGCSGTHVKFDVTCAKGNDEKVFEVTDYPSMSTVVPYTADDLPYLCYTRLILHTSTEGDVVSSWSQVISFKPSPPPIDNLSCQDGDRCYQLTAEFYKINKDVVLFNNYGPEKLVSGPLYRRNILLNYLYKTDPLSQDDSFLHWYGPVEGLNHLSKTTLDLPVRVMDGYQLYSQQFYPVNDIFQQYPRDCDYYIRPLGFTSKLHSSIYRTNREVIRLGAVDEGWVYVGGQLLAEVISPEGSFSEQPCTEIRLLEQFARVWMGRMVEGECEIDENTEIGKTIKIEGGRKLEIFLSQRRNCASKVFLELKNFKLVPESDIDDKEPSFIYTVTEWKPIGGYIATLDLANPYTLPEYTIEILNSERHFWFVDESYPITPDTPEREEVDPGHGVPGYVPWERVTPPTPLPDKSTFTVNSHNVTMVLARPLDVGLAREHNITYRVTGTLPGGGTISNTGRLVVVVEDYNDHWPLPASKSYIWPGLDSDTPTVITAADEDLEENSELEFYVGEIERPADEERWREEKDLYLFEDIEVNYTVTLHMLDKGRPRMGNTATISIKISTSCVPNIQFEIDRTTGVFSVRFPGFLRSTNPRVCDRCEAGYYCTGYRTRAQCTTCNQELAQSDGEFVIVDSDPNCNRSKTEFSFGGAAECQPCKLGWRCSDGIGIPVQEEGKYIEECTWEGCPEVQDCPPGAACQFGIKHDCAPGSFGFGPICRSCAPGTISEHTNTPQCTPCPAGYESTVGKDRCEPCAFNERSDPGSLCVACRNTRLSGGEPVL
eukprot:sb/3461762/